MNIKETKEYVTNKVASVHHRLVSEVKEDPEEYTYFMYTFVVMLVVAVVM